MKPDHYDDSHNGHEDIFIAKLSADLTTLHNSTYIGGIGGERAYMMDLGPGNLIYLAGYSYSSGFPVTTGSFDTSHNGNSDAIALKFRFPGAPDRDDDGVPDEQDAFPDNPFEYRDTDGDGIGDNLDLDADGDGIGDFRDAFPLDPKETIDTDKDGTGDNADADDDNDGVNDTKDKFPLNPFEFADTDEDGIGNNLDPDDDNDGTTDVEEVRNVIRKGLSTVEDLAASMQAQVDADLAGLNGSLHSSLDTLGSDFLGELRGLNASLADDIADTLQSISHRAASVGGGIEIDLADLHVFLNLLLSDLGSKLAATNSTLHAAMDDMDSRTQDLHGALTDDLFLLTVRLERIGSDLGEEDDAIRADIDALSKTVADLDGHTLQELEEVIGRLAANVSRYDQDTADDLADLAAEIAVFEEAMEGNMAALNTTLVDLDKLTAILADLEALDASLVDAQEELDRSVEDAGGEQASKGGLNTMLIVIIIVLVVLILVLLLRTPAKPTPPANGSTGEEDIIVSAEEEEQGGDDR